MKRSLFNERGLTVYLAASSKHVRRCSTLSYKNEAAFSKVLVTSMRNRGWFVQRIESGETGKGIPDIYAVSAGGSSYWLELKRVHKVLGRDLTVEIPWRPGQQSWLHAVTMRNQKCRTLACFDDGILEIPHDVIWPKNVVLIEKCRYYKSIKELLG